MGATSSTGRPEAAPVSRARRGRPVLEILGGAGAASRRSPGRCGMTVLVTGGAGYIGSHTWLALVAAGYNVVGMKAEDAPDIATV